MTTEGFTAFFHNKGRTIKLYFNTKGWFEYTEQTYKENELNQDLKTLINTRFPGWIIEMITEINDASQFLYEAHISKGERNKILVIRNREIESSNEYVN